MTIKIKKLSIIKGIDNYCARFERPDVKAAQISQSSAAGGLGMEEVEPVGNFLLWLDSAVMMTACKRETGCFIFACPVLDALFSLFCYNQRFGSPRHG